MLRGSRKLWLGLVVLAFVGLLAGGATYAAFRADTSNGGNSYAAETDATAPTIVRTVIKKTTGYSPAKIKSSQAYYAYAQVTDAWNVNTVTANLAVAANVLTTGATAVKLCSNGGPWTVAGLSYNYRSDQDGTCGGASPSMTSNAGLTNGAKTWTLTAVDTTAHSTGAVNQTVTVDVTVPTASDSQIVNGGGTVGRPDSGDTVTYTFSEAMDPDSIISGWDGTSTAIRVRVTDDAGGAGCVANTNDKLELYTTGAVLLPNIGCMDTGRNAYVTATANFNATIVQSGATVTVTLGSQIDGTVATHGASRTSAWRTNTSAFDEAANAITLATDNEGGAGDANF